MKNLFPNNNERGFTLIEIIIAMVLIGIAVPSIMIPFSGLSDTKNPEYTVQASFIAQKRIERMADKTQTSALADCNNGNEGAYNLNCVAITVNAANLDTNTTATFATRITLTISRADGAMSPLIFTTLITNTT